MNLQEAVDASSFRTEHTLAELDQRGHSLEIAGRWEHYNSVTMAARDGESLRAAASPRRMQCLAMGR